MKVLVIDDRPLVQRVLATIARNHPGVDQVCDATSTTCDAMVRQVGPDVGVVGEVHAADLAVCRELSARGVRSLVLTDGGPDHVLELIEAGAVGVSIAADGLGCAADALRAVASGNSHVPAAMLGGLLKGLIERKRQRDEASARLDRLSSRERDVLALLGTGATAADIARRLVISPHTAKSHVQRVIAKLEVDSRVAAAQLAVEQGLVPRKEDSSEQ